MNQNPFAISFGRVSTNIIQRDDEFVQIYEDFNTDPATNTVYILTGPRGCGKTVSLSNMLDNYRKSDNWVVARLSQSDNMLEQMASLLYEHGLTKFVFLKKEFSFSFQGISFNVKGEEPTTSIEVYLSKLLAYYKKKNIHILVAIDDVVKTPEMVNFIRAYQGFLIDHYDVRLLMTGLYKNISKLESDKGLTFLFRAPKLQLSPLSFRSISFSYEMTFGIPSTSAMKLAKLTKGYAFAYQILGDILYRSDKKEITAKVLNEFDLKLSNWSYEIIWEELTGKEKQILTLIAKGKKSNEDLLTELNTTKGNLAIYKKQLADQGLLNVSTRGYSEFALPRFEQFILSQIELDAI